MSLAARSLWLYPFGQGCCGDELSQTISCQYDLERMGCLIQLHPENADVLMILGAINQKLLPELLNVYRRMPFPKFVMALGACACSGGLYKKESSYGMVQSLSEHLPIDIYVPGCPPRPEAIMSGILKLQEIIYEKNGTQATPYRASVEIS